MSKESKAESVTGSYGGHTIPKAVYDDLLDRYERSLLHLGQIKEQNRYMLEYKSNMDLMQKDLADKTKLLSEKEQSIAELKMYIDMLEEKNKNGNSEPVFFDGVSIGEKGFPNSFCSLDIVEVEALDDIFKSAGKSAKKNRIP